MNRTAPDTPSPLALSLRTTGLALRRHPQYIVALQCLMLILYVAVVLTPVLLPGSDTAGLAQFFNWGLWWPLAILSVLMAGRIWCGLLCPEGAVSEWVSQRGLGRPIPSWVRWGGWPLAGFLLVTLYGQLTDVYSSPAATLLLLGGSTTLAMLVGLLYGRGKRVWCRYLCPVTGVFGLLAKTSSIAFAVDREAWELAPRGQRTARNSQVNCAPLLDIRRMESASDCNMCGRCAGERDAVHLVARSPNAEILKGPAIDAWQATLLLFGLLGMGSAAFHWQSSPWAAWLRQDPWLLAGFLATVAMIIGGWLWLWLHLAAKSSQTAMGRFSPALIPYAGANTLAGLSLISTSQLAALGHPIPGEDWIRGTLLVLGLLWSLGLAYRLTKGNLQALTCVIAGLSMPAALWL